MMNVSGQEEKRLMIGELLLIHKDGSTEGSIQIGNIQFGKLLPKTDAVTFNNPQYNVFLLAIPEGASAAVEYNGILGSYAFNLEGGAIYNLTAMANLTESELLKNTEINSMIDANKLDFLLGNISFTTAILGPFTKGAADIVNSVVSLAATESSGIIGFRDTQNQITALKNKWYDTTVTMNSVIQAERDFELLQDWIGKNDSE